MVTGQLLYIARTESTEATYGQYLMRYASSGKKKDGIKEGWLTIYLESTPYNCRDLMLGYLLHF